METSIRKLFSDQDRKYKVPTYQRSYSWDNDQVSQFIQDLREAAADYYLGHFLFESDDSPNAKTDRVQTWLIIDGQQRLTTCLIFFSALHTELCKRQSSGDSVKVDISDLEHLYLRDSRKGTQRMETVADDNNFFASTVIDRKDIAVPEPRTKSQKRIRNTLDFFQKTFEKETLSELERWHDLVADAKCTHYCVSDKVTAAKIFAFQNDRGKDLSNLEILKSYFMLQVFLHGGEQEVMAEHLQYVEKEISTIYLQIVRVDLSEDDVLRYCWQACEQSHGFNTPKPVDEIKAYIVGSSANHICARIRRFMTDLAESFRIVERIEKSHSPAVVNLRYLDNMAISYPFLIKAGLNRATDEETDRLARMLENITFRSKLRGGRADIQSRLNGYLTLTAGPGYVSTVVTGMVRDLRSNVRWEFWSDKVMLNLLDTGYFYQNRVDNYMLWRYELDLCDASGYPPSLKVGYGDLVSNESIEHIAPQTETTGGSVKAGYGAYSDSTNPKDGIESGGWMNCLGNLLLISRAHNSSIGNDPFQTKLASYGKDNLLAQQKEVVDFVDDPDQPVWNVSAITKRKQKILKTAMRLWSLDGI
jgi:Protein of unknown function DUF262/Protein of unknown function (DUF1524)